MAFHAGDRNPSEARWDLVRYRAGWLLEHSSVIDPALVAKGLRTHTPQPRLGTHPGFSESEPTSITVFESFDHASHKPMVREAGWHSRSDWRRFHGFADGSSKETDLEPTFSVRDAGIPGEQLKAILRSGSELLVPIVWTDEIETVTCDAGENGFEFFSTKHDPPPVLRPTWSWDTPESWTPVKEWVARIHDFLEGCLKNSK